MKIGLLGGSFNPPHQGHIHISQQALKSLKLNQIWWLPNKQNPLKELKNSAFDKRLKACEELTKDNKKILVKAYETQLKSNYSLDLLKLLKRQYKQHQFFFIIGADSLINLHLWHRWREIINFASIIILDRTPYSIKATRSKAFAYFMKVNNAHKPNSSNYNKCYFIKSKRCDVSSSLIRKKNYEAN